MLPVGFVQQQAPADDTADYDHDATTDKFVLVAWADVTGNWPNLDLPLTLLTPSFTLLAGTQANTSTKINFSAVVDRDFAPVHQPAGHCDGRAYRP